MIVMINLFDNSFLNLDDAIPQVSSTHTKSNKFMNIKEHTMKSQSKDGYIIKGHKLDQIIN